MVFKPSELIDPMCQIPLPIAPNEAAPLRPKNTEATPPGMNRHHPAVGEATLLRGGLGQRAIRFVREQWVEREIHFNGYHGGGHDGLLPRLPKTDHARFMYTVMADSLYLPDACVDFVRDSETGKLVPFVRALTQVDRDMMWERNDVKVDRPGAVNNFLGYFIASQGILRLKKGEEKTTMARFLDDPRNQMEPLLKRVAQVVTDTTRLGERYEAALASGNLPPTAHSSAVEHLTARLLQYAVHADPRRGDNFRADSPRTHLLNAVQDRLGLNTQKDMVA